MSDREVLTSALDQIREAADCILLQNPGHAMRILGSVSAEILAHLKRDEVAA